ncbi:endonuclease/exonuclease/phosphatase family protein [Crateriforma spongiae]|uniref:endonuclease/exonuclease/phosphatase family protein n=1 Tax=Crateriforma spongiae TaxID=2724528 RepID=UPI001447DCE5|nr:endonuclease/exonuclease/phosphatase family protein [Crateriforma spongiae]
MRFAVLVLSYIVATTAITDDRIRLDGDLSDWTTDDVIATDASGDATKRFDFTSVSARVEGATVYLRFDNAEPLNLAAGDSSDGTLRLLIDLPRNRRLVIDLRDRSAMLETEGAASSIPWSLINFAALPTYASTDFELRIGLSSFGVSAGDSVTIDIEGSDELDKPVTLTIGEALKDEPPQDTSRPDGVIRVASINTLHQGTKDPDRSKAITKLITMVNADVVLFNEEWNSGEFYRNIAEVMGGGLIRSRWSDGCGIATRHKLTALPVALNRGVAGFVQMDNGDAVVAIGVHFKCCGASGTDEDLKRIDEAKAVAVAIDQIRNGDFGDVVSSAPIIVLGDYNLVGSRDPLDIIEAANMAPVTLRSPIDGSAVTWAGMKASESFWPGRLDWAAVSDVVDVRSGWAIDHRSIGPDAEPVSDHKMLVVDIDAK